MNFLNRLYATDVLLYCAWSSLLALGQAHYKFLLIIMILSCLVAQIRNFTGQLGGAGGRRGGGGGRRGGGGEGGGEFS